MGRSAHEQLLLQKITIKIDPVKISGLLTKKKQPDFLNT